MHNQDPKRTFAAGMPNARSMALDEKGTVFVGSRLQDKFYAITNRDGKRQVHVLVSGLYRPNVPSRTLARFPDMLE